SSVIVFQCRLFRWYPGPIASYAERSWTASSGSHLTLTCSGSPSRWLSANIFPPTLNTDTSSPNGNSSLAPGSPRHRSLSHSAVNSRPAMVLPIPWASSASSSASSWRDRAHLDREGGAEAGQGAVAIAVGSPGFQADRALIFHV